MNKLEVEDEFYRNSSTPESRAAALAAYYADKALKCARAGDQLAAARAARDAAVEAAKVAGLWYRHPHLADFVLALFEREIAERDAIQAAGRR